MKETIDITERKPIWMALSEFYLDTELQETDFRYIAQKIQESPYSFEKVKEINKYEIFPVLQPNLLGVAGAWAGFDEAWLVKSIVKSLSKRNALKRLAIESSYAKHKWMCQAYWEQLEKIYRELESDKKSL